MRFSFREENIVLKIPEDCLGLRKLSRRFPNLTWLPRFELGSASLCRAQGYAF